MYKRQTLKEPEMKRRNLFLMLSAAALAFALPAAAQDKYLSLIHISEPTRPY